jgi:predicted AlkP superfamily phosphohydrolase/phosphomutase
VGKLKREKFVKYLEKNVKKIHRKNGEKVRKQSVRKM